MSAAAATSTGVYVYGVIHADEVPAIAAEGVAATPVELLEHDGLAALVSRLPSDFRVKRRDVDRHLHVLEEAFAEATVVPCAFGTVLASEDDVETVLLSERAGQLRAALDRLRGMVQLNVKAVYDEAELLRELVAENAEVAQLRERTARLGDAAYYERVRLGEVVAGLLDERRSGDASRILSELSSSAEDVVVDDPGEYDVLKGSFLVSRKKLERFDNRLEKIAARMQPVVTVEVIGPLPPTAFAAQQ